jgi:hypothetical protein
LLEGLHYNGCTPLGTGEGFACLMADERLNATFDPSGPCGTVTRTAPWVSVFKATPGLLP